MIRRLRWQINFGKFEENKEKRKESFELCNENARKGFDGIFPAKSIKKLWMLNELSRVRTVVTMTALKNKFLLGV